MGFQVVLKNCAGTQIVSVHETREDAFRSIGERMKRNAFLGDRNSDTWGKLAELAQTMPAVAINHPSGRSYIYVEENKR